MVVGGLQYKRTIVHESDIDDIKDSGFYFFSGTSSSNWLTDDGLLLIFNIGPGGIYQFKLQQSASGAFFHKRVCIGGVWSTWV